MPPQHSAPLGLDYLEAAQLYTLRPYGTDTGASRFSIQFSGNQLRPPKNLLGEWHRRAWRSLIKIMAPHLYETIPFYCRNCARLLGRILR